MAEHFDIRLADMTSKRRPENIAFPRQIAMFLSRQMTESSLNAIGEAFGGRDHGTVLHACRLVKDRMEVDANVRQVVSYLEKQLHALSRRERPDRSTCHADPRPPAMPAIEVSGLTKTFRTYKKQPGLQRAPSKACSAATYEQTVAVKDVSFNIEPGELVGFLGPERRRQDHHAQDAGRACSIPPAARPGCWAMSPGNAHDGYRRQFALLLGQKNQLWWDLPARESFELNARIYGIPSADLERTRRRNDRTAGRARQAQRQRARTVPGRAHENGADRRPAAPAQGAVPGRAHHRPGRRFAEDRPRIPARAQRHATRPPSC